MRTASVAVDLEALMLLTAEALGDDVRLRNDVVDWCFSYHHFIFRPRLKQLLRRASPATQQAFAPFANALAEALGGRWPGSGGNARWSAASFGTSRAPDLKQPALINLRLRALLGGDLVYVGYTKRSIADALEALGGAGLLKSRRVGNRLLFSWNRYLEFCGVVQPLTQHQKLYSSQLRHCTILSQK